MDIFSCKQFEYLLIEQFTVSFGIAQMNNIYSVHFRTAL